jgi:DNA-binding beta-propeller fold protein YncE
MSVFDPQKSRNACILAIMWVALMLPVCVQAQDASALSPVALAANHDNGTLYVAQRDARRIAIVDTETQQLTTHIPLPLALSGLCLSSDHTKLIVTGDQAQGKVLIIDLVKQQAKAIKVGHTPCAPVLSADNTVLFVCNRYNNQVVVIQVSSAKILDTIDVDREPVAATLTQDGKHLLVLNHLPHMRADQDYTAAAISVINTDQRKMVKRIALPNGSNQLRDITLSPDGRYAYATHILARYTVPTSQLQRGWVNTNAMTVLDLTTLAMVNTVLLDDVDYGAANPWGIGCTEDGKHLAVALSGTDQLALIDRKQLHERLERAAGNQRVTDVTQGPNDVPNDLSFMTGIKKRVPLKGQGGRHVQVMGSNVYVAEYFSDSLSVVDCRSLEVARAKSISLGETAPLTQVRQGEMLFNSAHICFQQWQSCGSCHSDEGRVDALNWDLLNDGLGNPKNTKSLLLAHQTPPAMGRGVRANAEVAVRAGIRHIQFAVRPESEAQALDAYLKSLKPLPSPHLDNGALSEAAQRGKAVFEQASCSHCHGGSLTTNLQSFDVGTGIRMEEGKAFDTPTLVELWRTAPYLHDGRAHTVGEVLTTFNPEDKHGKTSDLSKKELADLEAYLLSL